MGAIRKAFFSGRMLYVFFYGISSGLPLLLIGSTLKTWMRLQSVDLTVIGFFSLVGLPYSFKFLWSPLMDRFVPPFLGRRRGWILITQLGLTLGLTAMAMINPAKSIGLMATLCFFIAFLSASQDICIDAYRRDILHDEELGLGSSMAINGYRIGMLIAGALAFWLAARIEWRLTYLCMSAIMAMGMVTTFLSPEPELKVLPPKTLKEAVVLPFADFLSRSHSLEILAFILLYKLGDSMASDMFSPLYVDLKFSLDQIALVGKTLSLWATILGGIIGGLCMVRWGIPRSLWVFGIAQMFSTFGFSVLSSVGNNFLVLAIVVVVENLCTGAAASSYVGFVTSLCNRRYSATQYALLSSVMSVPRVVLGSSSGFLAERLGYHNFYIFCTLLHLPGLLMLLRQKRWAGQ